MLVMMYGQVRVSYAMSRDGLLPKRLAKVHPKFKTPFLNTWTTGIIAALISGLIDLNVLAHLVNMGDIVSICTRSCCGNRNEKNTSRLTKGI